MFEIITLSNGLRIAAEKIPFVRSVAFGIFVLNGSRNENEWSNGISHFIEHMLFKGTANRSAKDIADQMDAIGGQLNAYTTKEHTCYYTRVLDEHFDIAIDVLSDMFFNSSFDNDEIIKERNVILEEINMYEDTPEDLVHDLMQYNVWQGDSLGYSILGTEETISRFDHNTIADYFTNHYRPENTVIAIAGNFDEKEIVSKIEEKFSQFQNGVMNKTMFEKTIYKPSVAAKEKDVEQLHLCLGFEGVPFGTDDTYVLAAFNTTFGGGMSSRLFQNIREEYGLAYSVYSYNSSYIDAGLFNIYAALNPAQAEEYFALAVKEIKNLFSSKITEIDLQKAKEQLKSNYIISLESSANCMSSIGRSTLLQNRILSPDDLLKKVDAVNLERVYALATAIFDFDKLSISAVGKIKKLDFKGMMTNAGK